MKSVREEQAQNCDMEENGESAHVKTCDKKDLVIRQWKVEQKVSEGGKRRRLTEKTGNSRRKNGIRGAI